MGEDSVLGFHLVGILAFSLSTQIFFFLATLVLSGFDPLVSVSQEIHSDQRKTFTCDKVKKFCGHQELSQKLGADFYFATPYHSWERGLNEHTNGLLRQFFPRERILKSLSQRRWKEP
ncbi:hypothetical protein BH695_1005 [Microcystis aeruginosa PCC 7806SL]|uniref:Genome sequencing data, contig C296 n=2 Tax=Microcystis aeruginosa (strain PCC 7806) TaxID=267872 RepID=A8YDZ7_MICA7|nr:hypothetical protein BH695_1005 [Microcystis aeruginosa PCC 7806SL]CAO89462.1 unnamed protein product [Microcystis aeruginosa PCC 7806]